MSPFRSPGLSRDTLLESSVSTVLPHGHLVTDASLTPQLSEDKGCSLPAVSPKRSTVPGPKVGLTQDRRNHQGRVGEESSKEKGQQSHIPDECHSLGRLGPCPARPWVTVTSSCLFPSLVTADLRSSSAFTKGPLLSCSPVPSPDSRFGRQKVPHAYWLNR